MNDDHCEYLLPSICQKGNLITFSTTILPSTTTMSTISIISTTSYNDFYKDDWCELIFGPCDCSGNTECCVLQCTTTTTILSTTALKDAITTITASATTILSITSNMPSKSSMLS